MQKDYINLEDIKLAVSSSKFKICQDINNSLDKTNAHTNRGWFQLSNHK
jgi:hypothetical protein